MNKADDSEAFVEVPEIREDLTAESNMTNFQPNLDIVELKLEQMSW